MSLLGTIVNGIAIIFGSFFGIILVKHIRKNQKYDFTSDGISGMYFRNRHGIKK